jgi:hypothetical protein
MLRKIFFIVVAISASGCDSDLICSRDVKWAVVDINKLNNFVRQSEIERNPDPSASESSNASREISNIRSQIESIERGLSAKCASLVKPYNPGQSIYPAGAEQRFRTPPGRTMSYSSPEDNAEYRDCLLKIQNDQLLADLKKKESEVNEIFSSKRKYNELIAKRSQDAVREAIARYALASQLDLVVSNYRDGIAFNKDNVVSDVTEAVLEEYRRSIAEKPVGKPE